ncbi:hypothetical protein EON63_06220 [archaeon]|nr:MAG: hypothetical protein EON63_06220 [archaeon]
MKEKRVVMSEEHNMSDIPKEELLHLCMKLNKRMQTMETKGKELLKKKNTVQSERDRLLKMIESTIGSAVSVVSSDGDLDLDRIESLYLSTVAKAAASSTSVVTPSTSQQASEPSVTDGNDSNSSIQHYKDTVKTLEQLVQSKQADLDKVNKHLEEVKLHQEEQVVYFQMQLQAAKQREDSVNVEIKNLQLKFAGVQKSLEEKEIHVATNRELLQALQARLIEIEPDLAQAKDKVNTLTILKMEQDALIQSLRKDLKNALFEKDSFSKRIVEVETDKLKYEGNSVKIQNLADDLNRKTEELEQLNVLLLRMRAEAASSERNIAMRVAMLATAEAQVAELKEVWV